MKLLENSIDISEELRYAIDNDYSIGELFFPGSKKFFECIKELKKINALNALELNEIDNFIVGSELGEIADYNDKVVPLDLPIAHSHNVKFEVYHKASGSPRQYTVYTRINNQVVQIDFEDEVGVTMMSSDNGLLEKEELLELHKSLDASHAGYWQLKLALLRKWYRPRRTTNEAKAVFPYIDTALGEGELPDVAVRRTYLANANAGGSWHYDNYFRTLTVFTKDSNWKYQESNKLPVEMQAGDIIKIKPGTLHRFISGDLDMVTLIEDSENE
jgi:hypothetical protein